MMQSQTGKICLSSRDLSYKRQTWSWGRNVARNDNHRLLLLGRWWGLLSRLRSILSLRWNWLRFRLGLWFRFSLRFWLGDRCWLWFWLWLWL